MDKAMTPTQPSAPTGTTARDVVIQAVRESFATAYTDHEIADGILSALAEAGLCIVDKADVQSDLMDALFLYFNFEDWTAAQIDDCMIDLTERIFAARQPEGSDGE